MSLGTVTIEARGLEKLLKEFPSKGKAAVKKSLEASGLLVQNMAKINAPFLTGNLRRSISHDVQGTESVKVGSDVVYAAVREFQTKRMPKGYLRPAFQDNIKQIKKIFEDNINKVIKGY